MLTLFGTILRGRHMELNTHEIDEPLQSWNEVLGEPQLEFDDTEIKSPSNLGTELLSQDDIFDDAVKEPGFNYDDSHTLEFFEENFEEQLAIKDSKPIEDSTQYFDYEKLNIVNLEGDDLVGRKIITISACNLPPKETMDYNKFLEFIIQTLGKFVENDYTIVYFHYGLNSQNKPSIPWLWQAYKMFDRKFKKNLKQLYIVHPSNFIKVLYQIFKPALSTKFGHKIVYMNSLYDLHDALQAHQIYIPDAVKRYDASIKTIPKKLYNGQLKEKLLISPSQLFGVELKNLIEKNNGPVPVQVEQITTILSQEKNIKTEGIFRRSSSCKKFQILKHKLNNGERLETEDVEDVHLLAVALKCFLKEMPTPLLTFKVYDLITSTDKSQINLVFCQRVINSLPKENRLLLSHIIKFLNKVAVHSDANKMNSINLGIVFGPNLLWKHNQNSMHSVDQINYFVSALIDDYEIIFGIL